MRARVLLQEVVEGWPVMWQNGVALLVVVVLLGLGMVHSVGVVLMVEVVLNREALMGVALLLLVGFVVVPGVVAQWVSIGSGNLQVPVVQSEMLLLVIAIPTPMVIAEVAQRHRGMVPRVLVSTVVLMVVAVEV